MLSTGVRSNLAYNTSLSEITEQERTQLLKDGYFARDNLIRDATMILGQFKELGLDAQRELRFRETVPAPLESVVRTLQPIVNEILGAPAPLTETHVVNLPHGYISSGQWHMDGKGLVTTKNGRIHDLPEFQLLVGVYFTELKRPNFGQLQVAPGGHLVLQEYFRRDAKILAELDEDPVQRLRLFERVERENPLPLRVLNVSPGDVLFAHGMIPHAISSNVGPVRPAVYFRFGRYPTPGLSALTDIWSGFPIARDH